MVAKKEDVMILINMIVVYIIFTALIFSILYYNSKDRKEALTIQVDKDIIRLFLSDDNYCSFDISDIQEDREKIDKRLVRVIQKRAKELVNFVYRVSFFNNKNKNFENELLKIIQLG